ncbi:MAG TPA: TlpA disulfide reductase family protein [Bryobacteraceae bacterium]|nr:TlpA disulfide reductase family protein [Bryobacteraceae bacterium]
MSARRTALLRQAAADQPHDYFLLRRLLQAEEKQDEQLRIAKEWRAKYPGRPVYVVLHARALMGRDTREALRMLEEMKAAHPEIPFVHTEIVRATGWGKFKDAARAKQELEAYLKQCLAPLDSESLSSVMQAGSQAQTASVAGAVRARLEKESDPLLSGVWEMLWRLEFKATPPNEHDALRRRIAAELAHFEKAPQRGELRWRSFLRGGYERAGEPASVKRLEDEILKENPTSRAAKGILQDRWRKEHPYPPNPNKATLEAWNRQRLAINREWHQRWPKDSLILDGILGALNQLPDTQAEQVAATGDKLMEEYRRNPNWWGSPPTEFRVANAFLKHKVNLAKVPGLVEEGIRSSTQRRDEQLADDRLPDEMRIMMRESAETLRIDRARILLDYYAAVQKPEGAREIETELASMQPVKPQAKSNLLARRAQAAELSGRKLDALLLYRAALDSRPVDAPKPVDGKDLVADNFERLWKELGGTDVSRALLMGHGKKTETATQSRWERPKNPIPSFSVVDLEGKTWKLAALEGKVVLINLWATWCGPCRAEHPEFQKLYDKLKGRADVSVVTFNIDDDLGKVAPYMKENKYTFPVLLAREVVDAVLPVIAIPQNWFVNAKGKLEWLQVGYGSEPTWQESMLAKLEEVRKGG